MSDPASLPIEAIRADFESAWRSESVLVLSAPTGSGKSTRVPLWLANEELLASGGIDATQMVYVVEPRRVACRALAVHLSRLHGGACGERIGYAVRFDRRTGPKTRVCFVTPGVALRLLASGELEAKGHTLMLDEFHERAAELDLLAAAARASAAAGKLRLVLCSATLDAEGLGEQLGARVLESEGRTHPVEISYRGEGNPSEEELETRVTRAVEDALGRLEGDVLVFLPGRASISRCAGVLGRSTIVGETGAELIEVHGGVSPDRLAAAFEGGTGRRVYLSTNVAESSVTLPGVRCVIDSGLVKRVLHRAGRSLLALDAVAQDAADQRAGRAGRVAPGVCWRLWGRASRLEARTPPELEGIELDDFLVRAATLGLEGTRFDAAAWITPPPAFAVERARARLSAAGVLDPMHRLTSRGRSFAALPVSAARAELLVDAPASIRGDLADLVARIEVDRALLSRGPVSGRVDEARERLLVEARDELEVELRCLRAGDARRHGLAGGVLSETRKVAAALRASIGAKSARPQDDEPGFGDRTALVRHVLARAPQFVFARRPRQPRGRSRGPKSVAWANDEGVELQLRPFEHPVESQREAPTEAPFALIFGARWLGVGRRARGVGELRMPIDGREVRAAGLGRLELGTPRIDRRGGEPRVLASMRWQFSSRVVESDGDALDGAALREAVTQLVMGGGLWPELGDAVRQDCLHRDLLVASPPYADTSDPTEGLDPEAWLTFRLEQLGLESNDELGLIEAEDLRLPLEAWGRKLLADPSLLDQIRTDFPRTFVERGAVYAIKRADLGRRRVVLEPINAVAKKRGELSAKLLPRYRGFAVFFEQASRRVQLR